MPRVEATASIRQATAIAFEADLEAKVHDEIALYQSMQDESLRAVRAALSANAVESVA